MKRVLILLLSVTGGNLINGMQNDGYSLWQPPKNVYQPVPMQVYPQQQQHVLANQSPYHPLTVNQQYEQVSTTWPSHSAVQPYIQNPQNQGCSCQQQTQPPQYPHQQPQMGGEMEVTLEKTNNDGEDVPLQIPVSTEQNQNQGERDENEWNDRFCPSLFLTLGGFTLSDALLGSKFLEWLSGLNHNGCLQIFYPSFANGCNANDACDLCVTGGTLVSATVMVTGIGLGIYESRRGKKNATQNNNNNN